MAEKNLEWKVVFKDIFQKRAQNRELDREKSLNEVFKKPIESGQQNLSSTCSDTASSKTKLLEAKSRKRIFNSPVEQRFEPYVSNSYADISVFPLWKDVLKKIEDDSDLNKHEQKDVKPSFEEHFPSLKEAQIMECSQMKQEPQQKKHMAQVKNRGFKKKDRKNKPEVDEEYKKIEEIFVPSKKFGRERAYIKKEPDYVDYVRDPNQTPNQNPNQLIGGMAQFKESVNDSWRRHEINLRNSNEKPWDDEFYF